MQRKWMTLFVMLMMLALPVQPVGSVSAVGTKLYVAPNGLTTGSCASWATACSLQYALGAAAPGSALWVKQGTYRPTSSTDRTVSFVLNDGVAIYGGFAGTETALAQRNPVTNITILSGDIGVLNNNSDNSYHVVARLGTYDTTILDGFTIQGGNANIAPNNKGGGMYNESGELVLTNVTFSSNFATQGGGMYNSSSIPILTNVTFSGNAATHGGGMFNNYADPMLTDVTFRDNSAVSAGGAMYNANSYLILTRVTFSSNRATNGAGMLNSSSSPALTDVTFSSNSATNAGGGMYTIGVDSEPTVTNVTFRGNSATYGGGMWTEAGIPTLTNVTFSDNSATQGGGMLNSSNSPILTNVTLSNNSASSAGGGMYNYLSNPALTNVTFSSNFATNGGGIYNISSTPKMINTIVANSTSGGDCVNNASTLNAASSHNLIEGTGTNACGLTNGTKGNIVGSDPNLGALADNGGFTQTHALNPGSPAINAGTNTGCPASDQRGDPRPEGAACDIGAFEFLIGGPDSFGYTYDNRVPYNWISADTDSWLVDDDAVRGPIDIGFTFPFYGVPQTQLYFNTNGLITFGAGSSRWGGHGTRIPSDLIPNNFIAPFWDDLGFSLSHSGVIYYSRGGSAPNRYFVVEWRRLSRDYDGGGEVTFEAILYENGDIVIQHQTLLDGYYSTVGIEDSSGYQGLQYQAGTSGLSAPRAIRFYYPTTPAARVMAYPLQPSGFAPLGGHSDFSIVVVNQGSLGTDRYDLNSTSTWPVAYYASDGVTLLTDTDGDSLIDTGSLAQSESTTIIARYQAPSGAVVGDSNSASIQFTSSLNTAVSRVVALQMSIPAGFASVFKDHAKSSLSLLTASADGTQLSQAISDNYDGFNGAVAQLANGNYFYVWWKRESSIIFERAIIGDIEYAILDREGQLIRPPGKLTDNDPSEGSYYTRDSLPSIAVAPDGTVGVVWYHYREFPLPMFITKDIAFATLNEDGDLLTGPASIASGRSLSDNPTIAASSDNRFIIGWETYDYNVWYAVRDTAGGLVKDATALTGNNISQDPILNCMMGGKVIMTWLQDNGGTYYAVINSNGTIAKPGTSLGSSGWYSSPDAVGLPNGKTAVAWLTETGVEFSILNAANNIESGPHYAASPHDIKGESLSVTTDPSSHVIMTWIEAGYGDLRYKHGEGNNNKHFYALGDSTGAFLTDPMIYYRSEADINGSLNGQGNTTYPGSPVITVSGNAGAAGVTLSYNDGTPKTVISQPNGDYSLTVPGNWSGTVTPAHPCYTFSPPDRSYSHAIDYQIAQDYIPALIPGSGCADIDITIGMNNPARFGLSAGASTRASFAGLNNGPVKIGSTNAIPLIGAERVIYKVNNINTSFSETMGLPNNQLDTTYWLPWYNNKDLDTQLRFANVSDATATVHVYIGDVEMGTGFTLAAGASTRQSFAGINNGPVQIVSDQPIVAAERVIYKVNNVNTSFSEMMALPNSQLDTTYWLPWYNNKDLDTQLRFANVNDAPATVHIYIGGAEMGTGFTLDANESTRVSFPAINSGPVQIVSDIPIVAAERVIYRINNINTSFSEMMALPDNQLDTAYWLPWYNNKDLDTQLRFANVNDAPATVHIYIGGVEMGTGFTLDANESTRVSFAGINSGPVQIVSDLPIVAAERVIYKVNNVNTSFSEMMGLPNDALDTVYWLPWYNNVDLDTQLRFGVP